MHRGTHLLGWCVKLPCGDAFGRKAVPTWYTPRCKTAWKSKGDYVYEKA